MTVDEAIICLSDMKIKVAIPKAAVQARLNNDALNMAIEALNCSEIPNNSDTISRQAVTKFLNDWLLCLFENCHKQSASDLKMIIKDFKNMPSAQLNHNAEVSKMGIVHCEDCEHWDTSWETAYGLHYCPMIDMSTNKNFFCKYGAEKRGEVDEAD